MNVTIERLFEEPYDISLELAIEEFKLDHYDIDLIRDNHTVFVEDIAISLADEEVNE